MQSLCKPKYRQIGQLSMCVRSRYKSDISGGLPVMSDLPYMSCDVYYTFAKCPESPNFRFDIVSRLVYNSVYKRE